MHSSPIGSLAEFGALEAIPAAVLARVPVAIHSEHGYELEDWMGCRFDGEFSVMGFSRMGGATQSSSVTGEIEALPLAPILAAIRGGFVCLPTA